MSSNKIKQFRPNLQECLLEGRLLPSAFGSALSGLFASALVAEHAAVRQESAIRMAAVANITVTSPNSWAVWSSGSQQTISWSSSPLTGNVRIDLSRDGGQSWQTLLSSTPNSGRVTWTVNGPATAAARIRISSVNNYTLTDVNDANFAIIGTNYKNFYGGYCTEFAARQFDQVAPSPGVNWSGNAGAWYANAAGTWKETRDPNNVQLGAIAVWSGGSYGHVAVVSGISRDARGNVTQLTFREQNAGTMLDASWAITSNFGKVTTTTLYTSNLNRGPLTFVGFILPVKK